MRASIILCLLFFWVVEGHGTLPALLAPIVIGIEGENVCPSEVAVEAQLNVTKEEIKQRINDTVNSCGGIGWTRIAYLDMTDPGSVCPTNWTLHTSPVRGCGQTQTASYTCDSAFFSVSGQSYSRVCGRILAYQKGSPDAFHTSIASIRRSIDSAYVDGVSVTHGPVGSRQHIWTFAASVYEQDPAYNTGWNCPCTNIHHDRSYQFPSFLQNNYFCDTGNPGPGFNVGTYYSDDPLWDGAGCGEDSTCCQFNKPPWFYSSLPQATKDDVEARLCFDGPSSDEDIIIYLLELFVSS